MYLALLSASVHMVSTDAVYGPSRGLMEKHMSRFGVQSSYEDTSDLANLRQAIQPNTKLVYIETPSNPAIPSPISRLQPKSPTPPGPC